MEKNVIIASSFIKEDATVSEILDYEKKVKETFPIWEKSNLRFFHKSLGNDFGYVRMPTTIFFLEGETSLRSAQNIRKITELRKELRNL